MRNAAYLITGLLFLLPFASTAQEDSPRYDELLEWEGDRHQTLGPSGGRIFAERLDGLPGLRGDFGYCRATPGFQDPLILEFRTEDGELPLVQERMIWRPSHLEAIWRGGGIRIVERKFITDDDGMADRVRLQNTSKQRLEIDIHISGRMTPLLERFRSMQRIVDLSGAANMVPEQVPLRPGRIEYDSIGFAVLDPGPDGRPTLAALRGGIDADPARSFPESVSFQVPDVRPARSVLHLLAMVKAPGVRDDEKAPAYFEFRFDDATTERTPWPSPTERRPGMQSGRVEWHHLRLPESDEPAMRLAYTPPPGRFIREVTIRKGEGPGIPILLAATFEILPEEGRLPVLLGEPNFHALTVHLALAGDGFSPERTTEGHRGLYRRVLLEPGAEMLFNALVASGPQPFMAALKAMDAAADGSLFEKHVDRFQDWFDKNAPRFRCSDPLMEKAWAYRWYLARKNMMRPNTPDLDLPIFYDSIHGDLNNWVSPFSSSFILAEVRWLEDRAFAQGQVRALLKQQYPNGLLPRVRLNARAGMDTHWLPASAMGAFEVNGSEQYLKETLPLLKNNLDAVIRHFDPDENGLPSFLYEGGDGGGEGRRLERPDFASFLYASSRALARGLRRLDQAEEAQKLEEQAAGIQSAVLEKMWIEEDAFFHARLEKENEPSPRREIFGFYPFAFRLVPDEPRYLGALDALAVWTTIPVSSAPRNEAQRIYPHAESVVAEAMANGLCHYDAPAVTDELFARFLKAYTRLHFEEGDPGRPCIREWYDGETGRGFGPPDMFQSTYNDLLIRFVGGLVPRADGRIELWPLVESLEHFRFQRIPYHGKLLDIAWDRPDGKRIFEDVREGFTLNVNGVKAFHARELKRTILD